MEGIEIQKYTVSKVGKEKNGDAYVVKHYEKEQLLLAAVADGVSQQPCDWLASDKTCEYLVGFFSRYEAESNIRLRLEKSIHDTNDAVIATMGRCERMASTLSVVVWDEANEQLFYANIGDSRVYSLTTSQFIQLTKDDSQIIKERIFVRGTSSLVGRPVLTKVIGQPNIKIAIEKKDFLMRETLILATDGFYEARKATFEKAMDAFAEAECFEDHFKKVIRSFEMFRGDDFTVVMLRRG